MILAAMSVFEPILMNRIKDEQFEDLNLAKIRDHVADKPDFQLVDGVLYFRNQLCVPKAQKLIEPIMTEVHNARYAMHHKSTRMYGNLRANFGGII